MDPTCGLADKFRDLVLNLIWEQLLYLIYYHRNIDQLHRQLGELTRRRSSIQHQVDEAKRNGEQIEEEVLHWFGEVDKLLEQGQKFHEEESQANTECSRTSCPNPSLRYKLSKQAKAMTEAAEIYAKRNFDRISYPVPLPPRLGLTNREGNEGIDSRVPIMNQILEELKNPGVNMIGLCGPGGVGKTTIAKEVANNQKIFEKVIMATVSQESNIENIQGKIAEKLSMQLNENDKEVRAFRLCERLKQEKNMLLILDDLWKELDLGKVGIPLVSVENYSKENDGCKILLTSRDKALLSDLMKCQKMVEVDVLSEHEALELFKKIAELSTDSSSPELISRATDIVRKCGGLPLAIATAAKTLRNKGLNEFEDALARLNNPLWRNNTLTRGVDDILKLSYDRLRSPEDKHIFLLSAMLSHDPSIEDLLMYSVGLDVLKHTQNMGDTRNAILRIVVKLKSLNLFLDSFSSHHFTMHDVFRDVAVSIASEELKWQRRLNEWPDESDLECCKGICLQESDISDLPEELHGPRLMFFLLNSTRRDLNIPSMFFKSSEKLKVLAITNVHFSSLPSLIFLKTLKALCLHSCLLEDITEIRSLRTLKVPSLAYSEIERLPIELAELTSLQMLNLSHCSNLKEIPQKLLSCLKKLEVLYMGNSFHQWKVEGSSETNENASLDELMDLPISSLDIQIPNVSMWPENLFLKMNLRRYRILIGKPWKWWQVNYETSKILKLQLQSCIHLKGGVQKLLEGVEDLYLHGSNAHENVLHNHKGRGFPHLRHLQIDGNYGIRSDVFNSAHHEAAIKNVSNKTFRSLFSQKVLLPQLERLKLSNFNCLIPLIWDDQLSRSSLSNLKTLIVKSCGFVKLVPLHVLKSLNNLEELDVEDCDMLEKVFDFEDLNDYKEMESSSVVVPLKKLKLENLPKLKNVWSDHYPGNVSFPSLRSVDVDNCESLTSIFPASIAKGMLCDLEELQISECGVDVIVAKDQVSESVAVTFGFPRLTSLVLFDLPNLRNFYPQKHTLEWPHLKQLSIECCDELEIFEKEVSCSSEIYEEENMPDSKYPLLSHDKVIGNLERLTLQGKEVEKIGSGQFLMHHFPKLKLLHLSLEKERPFRTLQFWERSPNLGELKLSGDFGKALGSDIVAALAVHFPKLTLENISIMRSLSPSLVSSPNLTHLNVNQCHEWTTLMTSSIARSLVHLTRLSVGGCFKMEEIITKQEGEDDENKEIIFIKLKFLELEDLPRLKSFGAHNYTFKFLLLDQLIIKRCPKFKIFSPGLVETPCLKSVQLWENWEKQEIWDIDLNKTFNSQRLMVSREVVLDEGDAIMIRNDQFPTDCCPQVEILGIEGFVEEWVTFPYKLLERFPKLNELQVKNCSFKEIFPAHAPSSISFHNLTVLKVSNCHKLVYLVTSSTVKSLVNLETLEIDNCKKMEEIVRNETDEDEEQGITFTGLRILKLTRLPKLKTQEDKKDFNIEDRATNTRCTNISSSLLSHNKVLLPKLETLELSNLLNSSVSLLWDDQLLHNSFSNLKTLIVRSCDFMKLVPLRVLKSLNNLEKLEVSYCNKLKMLFGYEDLNDYYKEMASSSVVVPLSLTQVEVNGCDGLTTLMTSSAAPSLVHITHLSISRCRQIEEIITKREGEDDEDKEIFFNKMKFLKLDNLPRLKRFCRHNFTFRFPLMDEFVITRCPKFKSFSPGLIDTPSLKSVQLSQDYRGDHEFWDTSLNKTLYQQRYVISKEVVLDEDDAIVIRNDQFPTDCCPQVEILRIKGFVEEWVTFPYTLLERFPKLNELHVENSSFEEIFPTHAPSSTSFHNLTVLKVSNCHQLVYLVASSTVKSLVNLEILEIDDCEKMEEIVRNETNEDVEGGPSTSFHNLTVLKVSKCHQLVYLVTRSTVKSLVNLETLEIDDCEKMEEIVRTETNEDVEGGPSTSFHNLTVLKVSNCHQLVYLVTRSTVKSLVNLETLEIDDCEKMEEIVRNETDEDEEQGIIFTGLRILKLTHLPKLKIQEDKKDFNIEDRAKNTRCTNISRSLLSHNKVLLPKLETLELSNLLNSLVSLIWDDQLLHNSFSNVKTLIFESCDSMKSVPLRVLKSLNNLEKLEVSNCDKLEMVFGFEDLNDYHKEMASSSVIVPLSLTQVEVNGCDGLTSVIMSSAAPSLVHIAHLSISYCDQIEEIIVKQEGGDDEDKEIVFNKMKFLELDNLPKLKRFCRHNFTFRFPLMDELVITRCPKFRSFSPGLIDTPSLKSVQLSQDYRGDHHEIWDTSLNKTLYQQRYVRSRELVLDEDDAIMIRNDDQFPADCCPQVEILRIEGFVNGWVTFPYTMLERFPKLNELHVNNSSFEEIFPSHAPSPTSFHNLTLLKVSKCHQLVYLVACSIIKNLVNLETLEIDNCEKLKEIVRNDTNEDVEQGITFSGLRILKLTRLPKLKTQEDKKDFNIEDRAIDIRCTNISGSLFSHNKVLLPKLETLELSNLLNSLVSLIWDDQLLHNSFSNVKTLIFESCDSMKSVPLRVLKSLNNLEKLEVSNCDKLEMVFGFEDLNDYHKEMASSSVIVPLSLTQVEVNGCDGLTSVIMSSAAPSLVHIAHLSISYCDQIEEIIVKQEGGDDEDKEIFFNQMNTLELVNLPRLKRFCGYNYTFRFPLLEHVTITECPQLTMFCLGAIHTPRLRSVQVSNYEADNDIWMTDLNNTIQHLFTFEEVISTIRSMALNGKNMKTVMGVFLNVETLYVESFTEEGVTFPYSSLERFPKLNWLNVEHCSFEEIFPSQDEIIDFMGNIPPFKELNIANLDKLKSIWKDDSKLPPLHQNLGGLKVKNCCSLVKLAPSSASFQNLWRLSVAGCHQLIHLLTTSTAESLVSLERLDINDCKKMVEIVMNDTNEDVQGEITFNQLEKIKLTDMPSLKMFSSQSHTFRFPELQKIKITGCPEMKMFCQGVLETRKLSKVKIEEHDMECKDERDLNKIIEMLSLEQE